MKTEVLKYYDKLYKNSWFLVKKKYDKYYIVNTAINMNQYIICNINLLFNIEEFVKKSTELVITSLINFYSGYNQVKLYSKSCDMTAF